MRTELWLIGSVTVAALGVAAEVEPALARDVQIIAQSGQQALSAFGDAHKQIIAALPPDVNGLLQCAVCLLALFGAFALFMLPHILKAMTIMWGIQTTRDAARYIIRDLRDG